MIEIKVIEAAQTLVLRQRVMWPDKSIEEMKLPEDDEGVHYGLYADGELVSVISLFFTGADVQFRKFATSTERQRNGYGGRLLQHVMREAVRRGCRCIWCNARADKVAFYKKFGMCEEDGYLEKDGRRYIKMTKTIAG